MFEKKKKDPLEYTQKITTVADMYSAFTSKLTIYVLSMLELDTNSIVNRQKAFGFITHVMFGIIGLSTSEVYTVIDGMQHNMYYNGMSEAEINNFFMLSDKYYRQIAEALHKQRNLLDVIQFTFFDRALDAVTNMENTIKTSCMIQGIVESYKKFDNDMRK